MSGDVIKRVRDFISPYLESHGLRYLLCEYVREDGNWYLRLYIDLSEDERKRRQEALKDADTKDDQDMSQDECGVTIADCTLVSRYLSRWLDRQDVLTERYTLEVCSRGFMDGQ